MTKWVKVLVGPTSISFDDRTYHGPIPADEFEGLAGPATRVYPELPWYQKKQATLEYSALKDSTFYASRFLAKNTFGDFEFFFQPLRSRIEGERDVFGGSLVIDGINFGFDADESIVTKVSKFVLTFESRVSRTNRVYHLESDTVGLFIEFLSRRVGKRRSGKPRLSHVRLFFQDWRGEKV